MGNKLVLVNFLLDQIYCLLSVIILLSSISCSKLKVWNFIRFNFKNCSCSLLKICMIVFKIDWYHRDEQKSVFVYYLVWMKLNNMTFRIYIFISFQKPKLRISWEVIHKSKNIPMISELQIKSCICTLQSKIADTLYCKNYLPGKR